MYRVGFPGWKIAARFGVPLLLRVEVMRDAEVGVFIATSPDLRGLVAEANTLEDLFRAVYDCADMLLEDHLKTPPKRKPLAAWSGELLAT
jgi:predicted RNase H-like HicB family nuclease